MNLCASLFIRASSRIRGSFPILARGKLEEVTALFLEKRNHDLTVRLTHENVLLSRQVDEHKNLLNKLEVQHKVPQISRPPFPRKAAAGICTAPPVDVEAPKVQQENKPTKLVKKEKKDQPKKVSEEAPIDVSRLDFRVGRIISAKKHPDADSLYVEEVDVGEEKPWTVVSGLVKFVPIEQMQNRMAVLLCNLKPVKMRGIVSQAMVMCASTPDKVEILNPPAGSQPGDQVYVDGYTRNPDPVLNPKLKIFETVAPELKTDANKVATYKGIALHVPGKGNVTAPTLTGVLVK